MILKLYRKYNIYTYIYLYEDFGLLINISVFFYFLLIEINFFWSKVLLIIKINLLVMFLLKINANWEDYMDKLFFVLFRLKRNILILEVRVRNMYIIKLYVLIILYYFIKFLILLEL